MDLLQVIAEPRRRQILAMIWDVEMAAGDIADRSEVTFGAISQHLSVLREAGVVVVRKDGNRRLYRADQDSLGPFKDVLETMWGDTLQNLADSIESEDQ